MWDNPVPEEKRKCYVFEITAVAKAKGYVWAETREEAEELINRKEYDEIDDIVIDEVCDIEDIKEE